MTTLALAALCVAAAPAPTFTDVWEGGRGGYALYRIPGLVVTARGTLLAYCEARKSAGSDWGTIDLQLRRSEDGGRTWSPPLTLGRKPADFTKNPAALKQKLGGPDDVTFNNPVAIADPAGPVHVLYCLEYARCFYLRSDDDGRTFTEPVEVTKTFEAFRPEYDWRVIATGPGHGIRLKGGRLVVAVWLSTGTGGHAHRPSVVSTVFSDDNGKTWARGDVAAHNTKDLVNPNETCLAELSDGRVMLNVRSESPRHRRAVCTSPDGATKWSAPAFDDALVEPICFGSMVGVGGGRLLFANPANLLSGGKEGKPGRGRDRRNLTVRLSPDDGKTWPAARVLEPGVAGYSDLAAGPDGRVYCLFERGGRKGNAYHTATLTLAAFAPEWVAGGR